MKGHRTQRDEAESLDGHQGEHEMQPDIPRRPTGPIRAGESELGGNQHAGINEPAERGERYGCWQIDREQLPGWAGYAEFRTTLMEDRSEGAEN